jgi:hypothetical protein
LIVFILVPLTRVSYLALRAEASALAANSSLVAKLSKSLFKA